MLSSRARLLCLSHRPQLLLPSPRFKLASLCSLHSSACVLAQGKRASKATPHTVAKPPKGAVRPPPPRPAKASKASTPTPVRAASTPPPPPAAPVMPSAQVFKHFAHLAKEAADVPQVVDAVAKQQELSHALMRHMELGTKMRVGWQLPAVVPPSGTPVNAADEAALRAQLEAELPLVSAEREQAREQGLHKVRAALFRMRHAAWTSRLLIDAPSGWCVSDDSRLAIVSGLLDTVVESGQFLIQQQQTIDPLILSQEEADCLKQWADMARNNIFEAFCLRPSLVDQGNFLSMVQMLSRRELEWKEQARIDDMWCDADVRRGDSGVATATERLLQELSICESAHDAQRTLCALSRLAQLRGLTHAALSYVQLAVQLFVSEVDLEESPEVEEQLCIVAACSPDDSTLHTISIHGSLPRVYMTDSTVLRHARYLCAQVREKVEDGSELAAVQLEVAERQAEIVRTFYAFASLLRASGQVTEAEVVFTAAEAMRADVYKAVHGVPLEGVSRRQARPLKQTYLAADDDIRMEAEEKRAAAVHMLQGEAEHLSLPPVGSVPDAIARSALLAQLAQELPLNHTRFIQLHLDSDTESTARDGVLMHYFPACVDLLLQHSGGWRVSAEQRVRVAQELLQQADEAAQRLLNFDDGDDMPQLEDATLTACRQTAFRIRCWRGEADMEHSVPAERTDFNSVLWRTVHLGRSYAMRGEWDTYAQLQRESVLTVLEESEEDDELTLDEDCRVVVSHMMNLGWGFIQAGEPSKAILHLLSALQMHLEGEYTVQSVRAILREQPHAERSFRFGRLSRKKLFDDDEIGRSIDYLCEEFEEALAKPQSSDWVKRVPLEQAQALRCLQLLCDALIAEKPSRRAKMQDLLKLLGDCIKQHIGYIRAIRTQADGSTIIDIDRASLVEHRKSQSQRE